MEYSELEEFKQRVKDEGLEQVLRLYYSVYRAYVMDNEDEEERGRILISCPNVGHDHKQKLEKKWVDPAVDVTGPSMGWFNPPLVGSVVRVMFDNGNPGEPKCYFGGWFTSAAGKFPVPPEFGYVDGKPQKRGFRSRVGHALIFNDAADQEAVTILWRQIPDGHAAADDPDAVVTEAPAAGDKFIQIQLSKAGVTIADYNGTNIFINSEDKELMIQNAGGQIFSMIDKSLNLSDGASPASTISMTGDGDIQFTASKNFVINAPNINIEGGGVFLSKGAVLSPAIAEILVPWLAAHTHSIILPVPGTPTSPAAAAPTGPPPPAIISQSVKIK